MRQVPAVSEPCHNCDGCHGLARMALPPAANMRLLCTYSAVWQYRRADALAQRSIAVAVTVLVVVPVISYRSIPAGSPVELGETWQFEALTLPWRSAARSYMLHATRHCAATSRREMKVPLSMACKLKLSLLIVALSTVGREKVHSIGDEMATGSISPDTSMSIDFTSPSHCAAVPASATIDKRNVSIDVSVAFMPVYELPAVVAVAVVSIVCMPCPSNTGADTHR